MPEELQSCCKCKALKPKEDFHKDKSRPGGSSPRCKQCSSQKNKAYYSTNGKSVRVTASQYRELNREQLRIKAAEYNKAHRARITEDMAHRRADDPEKYKEISLRYRTRDPERHRRISRESRLRNIDKARYRNRLYSRRPEVRARQRERFSTDLEYREKVLDSSKRTRAKRRGATKTERILRKQVYLNDSGLCYLCGESIQFSEMHIEHSLPLSRGGSHTYDNVRCSCAPCNLSKGNKTPEEYAASMLQNNQYPMVVNLQCP